MTVHLPQVIFVVCNGGDANDMIHSELAVTNHLMNSFPKNLYLSRSTFILSELFNPRSNEEWADHYRSIIEVSDAVYCHEGFEDHPLVGYAFDLDLAVLHDEMDLAIFLNNEATT